MRKIRGKYTFSVSVRLKMTVREKLCLSFFIIAKTILFSRLSAYTLRVIDMKKAFVLSDKDELVLKAKHFVLLALCVFLGVCLISYPEDAKSSVASALKICSDTVIPSLFPFLFLSQFITLSGALNKGGKLLSFISRKLFSVPYEGLCVFIMSAVGGFPVGAKMTKSLLESGKIGTVSAKKLIFSCVCPAPAFAVTAVGLSLFSSVKIGLILYSSVVISSLILFLLSRFIFDSEDIIPINTRSEKITISSAFTQAGKNASESMISICCYVLLFSCLCDIMKNFFADRLILSALCGVCEVTTGCQRLSYLNNIPLIAGIIGWGGLSVHFQIMDCIEKAKLDLKLFFAARAVCAFISVIICDILLQIFPTVTEAVSLRRDVIISRTEKNLPVSLMMLLTCFIFLIGDHTVRLKKTKIIEK